MKSTSPLSILQRISKAVKMRVLCGADLSARMTPALVVLSGTQLEVWGTRSHAIFIEFSICHWISAMFGKQALFSFFSPREHSSPKGESFTYAHPCSDCPTLLPSFVRGSLRQKVLFLHLIFQSYFQLFSPACTLCLLHSWLLIKFFKCFMFITFLNKNTLLAYILASLIG